MAQKRKRQSLRKWRERERNLSFTASERQVTSQQRSTRERERMAAETPKERRREKEDYSG